MNSVDFQKQDREFGERVYANQLKAALGAASMAKVENPVSIIEVQSRRTALMPEQYETISKFDRAFAGLQGGNNLPTKPTTIEYVEPITGDAETFIVQTIRAEYKVTVTKGWETKTETRVGDFIVIKYVDKDGTKRLILPPKVAETIERQHVALSKKNRTNISKAAMRERMAAGYKPNFSKREQ